MKIEINTIGKMTTIEAKVKLLYDRKRQDYKKILLSISRGGSLLKKFPKSIENSITKRLIELKFIDEGNNITEIGKKMIENPELLETETGTYLLQVLSLNFVEYFYLIPEVKRQLSMHKTNLREKKLIGFEIENEFIMDNEILKFESLIQEGKSTNVFCDNKISSNQINIDLKNKTYEYNSKKLKLGTETIRKLYKYAKETLEYNPYGEFDFDNYAFILNNSLDNLSQDEIQKRQIEKFKKNDLLIMNAPFVIDNINTAYQFLYIIAANKMKQVAYFTLNDLNEIFINEILNSGVFTKLIQNKLFDFTYQIDGFSRYLPKKSFESLRYKLGVLELLLDFTFISNDFSSSTDFESITNNFNDVVPTNTVEACYIVMGYPFAKNKSNKFLDFMKYFSSIYKNAVIIKKGNKQNEDKEIIKSIENMEIPIYEIPTLKDFYHDRYIIFKLSNNSYKIFLVTTEIGQIFTLETNEKKGLIKELDYSEITKVDRNNNLLRIIERGIKNENK